MPHVLQRAPDQLKQLRLHLQLVPHLVVAEPRHVACRLHVRAEIEHVHQHLHVALSLLVAAVLPGDEQRPAVLHHEHRRQRVVRALVSRDHVRALRIEREQPAAVVQDESIARDGDARTPRREVAVDPRHHVSPAVRGSEIDRVAGAVGIGVRGAGRGRAIRIDLAAERRRVRLST